MGFPPPLTELIDELKKLPGIGPKSAQRVAIHLFRSPRPQLERFSQLLLSFQERITYCQTCFALADRSPCDICGDPSRDRTRLCIVAEPKDVLTLERSGALRGVYHVLGGLLSPLDGVGPDQLKTRELLERIRTGRFEEIIFALNPTVEGETTVAYLTRLLPAGAPRATRIATGLPMGSDMDFADEITLAKALEGRR